MRLFLMIALFFLQIIACAQYQPNTITPSPEATAMMKFVNTPVNLSTGVANVSVPFYTLEGRKLSVPVSINYHAKGIKVDEAASTTGAGWRLNAGGMITRVVRGLPDEVGYCGVGHEDGRRILDGSESHYHKLVMYNIMDGEPDIFYFNFLGRSGRFILDEDGNPHTIPYENIDIQPAIGLNGEGEWTITDENGVKYTFGHKDNNYYEETTHSINYERLTIHDGDEIIDDYFEVQDPLSGGDNLEYTSTWYLRKVELPDGDEEYSFEYTEGNAITDYNFSYLQIDKIASEDCQGSEMEQKEFRKDNTVKNPKYISRINGPIGSVEFDYNGNRKDLINGLSLSKILVKNFNDEIISRFNFGYRYREANWYDYGCLNEYCHKGENKYRLFLDKIYQVGSDGSNVLYRQFKYNEQKLPPRYSIHKDHWGYANNPNLNSYHWDVPAVSLDEGSIVLPGDEKGAWLQTTNGILTDMVVPTKGSVHYEYTVNYNGGGARIQKITQKDGKDSGNDIVKTYTYSEESYAAKPVYHYRYDQYYLNMVFYFIKDDCYSDFVIRTSQSMKALYDLDGASIRFGKVKEVLDDGSYTEYEFTSFDDKPDDTPTVYTAIAYFKNKDGTIKNKQFRNDYDTPPFSPYTYKGWERGLLTHKSVYDENGNLRHFAENDYYYDLADRNVTEGYKFSNYATDEDGDYIIHGAEYELISRPIRLKQTKEFVYETDEDGDKIERITDFYWNDEDLQLKKTESSTSNPVELNVTRYLYARDYDNSGFISKLNQSHQINKPVEVAKYKKYANGDIRIVGSNVNVYTNDLNAELKEIHTLPINSPVKLEDFKFSNSPQGELPDNNQLAFSKDSDYVLNRSFTYDAYGNITQSSDRRGNVINYTWGAENNYFYPTKISTTNDGNTEETTFIYLPMKGVIQETDMNGKSKTYEYDEFNRLRLVKDHQGNILKRYNYQYKIDNPKIVISKHIIDFSSGGSHETFEIFTDEQWEIIEIGPDEPWYSLSQSTGTGDATITVTKNDDFGPNYQLKVKLINEDDVLERIDLVLN